MRTQLRIYWMLCPRLFLQAEPSAVPSSWALGCSFELSPWLFLQAEPSAVPSSWALGCSFELSPLQFLRAEPSGTPLGLGHVLSDCPGLVLICIHYGDKLAVKLKNENIQVFEKPQILCTILKANIFFNNEGLNLFFNNFGHLDEEKNSWSYKMCRVLKLSQYYME